MAWRTAWIPPRNSCSATGICSGRSVANMALRCTVEVGTAGRSPRPGRPSASPGRRPPGRRGPLAPPPPRRLSSRAPPSERPPRREPRPSPSSSRRRLPEPGARITDTSGARLGVPLTSIRPSDFSGDRVGFAGARAKISIPSSPMSTVACKTAPTFSPEGTRALSTVPFGCRAPAARHVQVPSAAWLVSSTSIRRDMRRTRYRAERTVGPRGREESGVL